MTDLAGPLGLCIRAGACTYGFDNALKMMKKNRSAVVIVSQDASEGTKKKTSDKCSYYNTEIRFVDLKETFARLKIEGNIKVISVNDKNFKNLIDKRLKGET